MLKTTLYIASSQNSGTEKTGERRSRTTSRILIENRPTTNEAMTQKATASIRRRNLNR